ncbi:MAG: IS1 family transposase, partial [Aquificota bacterium]
MAIDKKYSYVENKDNDYWLWTVVADRRIKFFEIGKRTEETFYTLEEKLPVYK